MNKKTLNYILCVCIMLPVLIFLPACKQDLFYLHLKLNDKDAQYTQQYKDAYNYESNNVIKVVNPDLYDRFSINLPTKNDIIAPEGKVFAGWYLNQECEPDYYLNKTNWKKVVLDKKDKNSKSASIYVFWIDSDCVSITFNLNDDTMSFTDSYKASMGVYQDNPRMVDKPEVILNNLPNETNINSVEGKTFQGWYLDKQCNLELNENNLNNLLSSSADLTVYAKWHIRKLMNVAISTYLPSIDNNINTDFYDFCFKDEVVSSYETNYSKSEIKLNIWEDRYSELSTLLSTLNQYIDIGQFENKYQFDSWKMVVWESGNRELVEINQLTWSSQVNYEYNYNINIVAIWNEK